MSDRDGQISTTFNDILINESNNDVIIPISATYDKAVLHIGIGNRSGASIEKPELKQGKQLKTSVRHATRGLMETYFSRAGKMDDQSNRKQIEDRRRRQIAHINAVAKKIRPTEAENKKFHMDANFNEDSKGDSKEFEYSSNEAIACKVLDNKIEKEKGLDLNLVHEGSFMSKFQNKVSIGDESNHFEKTRATAKELSGAALRDTLSEMSTARLRYKATVNDETIHKERLIDEMTKELPCSAVVKALKEMESEKKVNKINDSETRDFGLFGTLGGSYKERLDELAKRLSETAVSKALLELLKEDTNNQQSSANLYLTKLSATKSRIMQGIFVSMRDEIKGVASNGFGERVSFENREILARSKNVERNENKLYNTEYISNPVAFDLALSMKYAERKKQNVPDDKSPNSEDLLNVVNAQSESQNLPPANSVTMIRTAKTVDIGVDHEDVTNEAASIDDTRRVESERGPGLMFEHENAPSPATNTPLVRNEAEAERSDSNLADDDSEDGDICLWNHEYFLGQQYPLCIE